jgi:hypothetical protein
LAKSKIPKTDACHRPDVRHIAGWHRRRDRPFRW